MSEILLESLRWGGVRIFWRGVREKGGSDEPTEPPLVTGLLLQPARGRVATAAKTVIASRLWNAMPIIQCT